MIAKYWSIPNNETDDFTTQYFYILSNVREPGFEIISMYKSNSIESKNRVFAYVNTNKKLYLYSYFNYGKLLHLDFCTICQISCLFLILLQQMLQLQKPYPFTPSSMQVIWSPHFNHENIKKAFLRWRIRHSFISIIC